MRKSLWSPDEDEKLRRYVAIHGCGNWSDVAKHTGLKRCGKSCRLRWINYLRPELKRGPFSMDEVRLVVNLHQHLGNSWSKIATHLPGRTDNDVKNFWHSYTRSRRMQQQQRQLRRPHQPAEINVQSKLDGSKNENPASTIVEINQEASYYNGQDYDQPLLSCSSIDVRNQFVAERKDVVKSPTHLAHNHSVYHQANGPYSTLHPSSSSTTNFIKPPHPDSPDISHQYDMELLFIQEANILKHTPYVDLKPTINAKACHPSNTAPPLPTQRTALYSSIDTRKNSSELQVKHNTTSSSQDTDHQISMPSVLRVGHKAAHCTTAISVFSPPQPMNDVILALNPQEASLCELLHAPADGTCTEELVDKPGPEGLHSVVWSFINHPPYSPDSFPTPSPVSFNPTLSPVHHYITAPPTTVYPHRYVLADQYSAEALSDCAKLQAQLAGCFS